MVSRRMSSLNPALVPLIEALARMAVAQEARETAEATEEIAILRSTLGLENDFPGWKRRAEALMKAYYKRVPEGSSRPLKDNLRLVITAVRELGPRASCQRLAIRAGELVKPGSRRPPAIGSE
jgi:hypothetical protein